MFKPSSAKTIETYLDQVPAERQELFQFLHHFIQKISPTFKPYFANNMIGYGAFPYLNYKKEQITWPVIGLASQKNYLSLYVCSIDKGEYVAEKFKDQLGQVKVGKSCITIKKLEDLNLVTLKKVLQFAAKHPGLTSISKK